jgi:hypothetical protein
MRNKILEAITAGEQGHAEAGVGTLVAAAGAIMLGIGAVGDDLGWLAITGGIVLAVGVILAGLLHHRFVDYDIYARLEKLEK